MTLSLYKVDKDKRQFVFRIFLPIKRPRYKDGGCIVHKDGSSLPAKAIQLFSCEEVSEWQLDSINETYVGTLLVVLW